MAVSENDLVVGPLTPAEGVTTISADFYFEQASWLEVYKSGSETPLVLNTDYTVAGAGSSSGVVTLTTAANGVDSYSVYLVVPLQRSSDMQLRGEFKSEPFNIEMDRLWQALQGVNTQVGRSVRLPKASTAIAPLLPVKSTGYALAWGEDGNLVNAPINVGDIANDLIAAQAAREGAELAQGEAEGAESGAAAAQSAAETARDKAQDWAEEGEDIAVEPGLYSAKHHAAKSAASATASQAAKDAATLAAVALGAYYDTTLAAAISTALGATSAGDQFAATGDDVEYIGLYRHDSGPVATEISRLVGYEYLGNRILDQAPPGYFWAVVDDSGDAAIGLRESDTGFVVAKLVPSEIEIGGQSFEETNAAPFIAWAVQDDNGDVAFGVNEDGKTLVADLKVGRINGSPAADFGGGVSGRAGGRFLSEDAFIITTGQSLGEGSTPATSITTAQEYDNVGFAARAADYSVEGLAALTVANCGVGSRGENPMFGTAGNIKALIAAENGLDETEIDYRLIGVNTAYSGYKIAELEKGTAPYADGIAAATRGKALADAADRTFAARAVTWTQGEGDAVTPTPFATYRDALIQLAADYDTDLKAVTGQAEPVYLICYQTATRDLTIARAQLEAMQTSPLIVMACPMYQFNYGDSVHIDAASSKWLGGYYGLAYKRTVIDAEPWEPLMPVTSQVSGSVIDLTFNRSGLVFDTTSLPAQTNQGFTVFDGGGAAQTISTVEIIQPNRVRITLSSGTPAAGWSVKYGHNNMTGRSDSFVGGGGNLRDRAGDILTYNGNRLDNWSVIFNWTL